MPRGVSQRKGAPAVKKQAPVPATSQEAVALAPAADVQAQLPIPAKPAPVLLLCYVPPRQRRPGRASIDDKTGDELKRYARSIGITQRNVDHLTEDRLRQNCKARVFESMED